MIDEQVEKLGQSVTSQMLNEVKKREEEGVVGWQVVWSDDMEEIKKHSTPEAKTLMVTPTEPFYNTLRQRYGQATGSYVRGNQGFFILEPLLGDEFKMLTTSTDEKRLVLQNDELRQILGSA